MVAAAVFVGCSGSAAPAAPPPSVPCGVSAVGAISVRRFCGTGSVTLTAGSQSTAVGAAECTTVQGAVTVNAGDLVLGHPAGPSKGYTYVGIDVKGLLPSAPGGTASPLYRGLISADVRGRVISVTDATVAVTGGGRAGTAQGRGRDGSDIKVTFSC